MSRGTWTTGAKNRRLEHDVRRIVDATFQDAIDCEFSEHHDFRFWEGMDMRLPIQNNGGSRALDVLVNRLHVEIGIRSTMGNDPRTIRSWMKTLETFRIVRPVHRGYMIVNRGRLGVLDDFFGSRDKVDEMCQDGYAKYLQEKEKKAEKKRKEVEDVVAPGPE